MKFNKFITRLRLATARQVGLMAIGALMLAMSAQAQVTPGTLVAVTNLPAIVTTTATSNCPSFIPIRNKTGLALQWRFNQTSACTSNATVALYMSVDGTNCGTTAFATLTAASTGATDVVFQTNWSGATLEGYTALVVSNIANATSLVTLTNKGILYRYPQ